MNTKPTTYTTPQSESYAVTGQQISKALEKHYNALREQVNTIKFQTNRLSNPLLVKNTALDIVTNGEYGKLSDQQRKLRSLPIEQEKCRQLIRDLENKYTRPPHLVELCRQIKKLEHEYNHTIENNNRHLATLQRKMHITIQEKRKLTGLEEYVFKIDTKDVASINQNPTYQEQLKQLMEKAAGSIIGTPRETIGRMKI